STRRDEIGLAERELASMQGDLYASLQQKTRLAALGQAVARIQHDLRNILANAKLASDRLSTIEDPVVKRLTPRLVGSLDRAVALATQTLRYGRAEERPPQRKRIALKPLVDDAGEAVLETTPHAIAFDNTCDAALTVDADPEHLFRIVLNLLRNAAEALSGRDGARIEIVAERHGRTVSFSIADNGPGIPSAMQANLFQPFAKAARAGGSGLGLAIARDLARMHGGDIVLMATGPQGTRPAIELLTRVPHKNPASVIDLGCGPGNSTALLARRWPKAKLEGLDSSEAMLDQARRSGIAATWLSGDIPSWSPKKKYDVIFANAALHWLDGQDELMRRL